jgi:hypothetical protein
MLDQNQRGCWCLPEDDEVLVFRLLISYWLSKRRPSLGEKYPYHYYETAWQESPGALSQARLHYQYHSSTKSKGPAPMDGVDTRSWNKGYAGGHKGPHPYGWC